MRFFIVEKCLDCPTDFFSFCSHQGFTFPSAQQKGIAANNCMVLLSPAVG
jgi:hypothetical protein